MTVSAAVQTRLAALHRERARRLIDPDSDVAFLLDLIGQPAASGALNAASRDRHVAALDKAEAALRNARGVINAVRIAVALPGFDPETHRSVVAIDAALAGIATLRQGETP